MLKPFRVCNLPNSHSYVNISHNYERQLCYIDNLYAYFDVMYHVEKVMVTKQWVHRCTMSFTNQYWVVTDLELVRSLIFISDDNNIYYFWDTTECQNSVTITECYDVWLGYLEIWYKICLPIVFYSDSDEVSDPV